jgi:hypothetical protein
MSNLMPERDDDIIEAKIAKFFPPHVLKKYQHLVEIDVARDGLHASNQAKINAEREKVREEQADVNWAERQIREGARHSDADEAAITARKARIAKRQRKIADMVEKAKPPPCLPLEPVTDFIIKTNRPLPDARVKVQLKSGESPLKAREASLMNSAALIEQRNEIENTLLPLDSAVARAVADIEQAAARGKAHHASIMLNDLAGDFGLSGLTDKRAVFIPDAHDANLEKRSSAIERIKSITGNDEVSVNRKNKPFLFVKVPAKIVLVANKHPKFLDESGALADREIVLVFESTFATVKDTELGHKLKAEWSGIANWAIEGLRRLRANGNRFTIGERGRKAQQELAESQSPALRFAKESLTVKSLTEFINDQTR